MARSLATPAPHSAATAAAAGAAAWVALAAALLAIPVSRPARPAVAPVASHGEAGLAWNGADLVYAELDRRARRVPAAERARVARVILEEAARADLAPLLVLAVIQVESGFDARAVSPVGAVGLMQLMLPTLREELALARLGPADPFDPVANVRAGVRYLARLVASFSDVELALMAYNAGPNRIRRHLEDGGVPARLLGYPRDVLRHVERLATAGRPVLARPARPAARVALAAAHPGPGKAAAGEAAALHHAPPARGAVPAGTLAALETGAPHAEDGALAAAEPAAAPGEETSGAPAGPAGDACTRLEPALPMGRGRDRPRPVERTVQG